VSLPKLRNLGQYGVITDVDPYDLPPNAFSMAVNARFRNNRATRAPVFRDVLALGTSNPRYLASELQNSGLDLIFIGYLNGTVTRFVSGAETNYSVSGYTPNTAEAAWSSCHLADLFYINRPDRAPWVLASGASSFEVLPNWPGSTTCGLIKSYASALVALNVTESGTNFPTVVRTSSFALAESVPTSWDYTNPATNATRNVLAEMEGPITDANILGNVLIIYSLEQTWVMNFDGSAEIFDYVQLPWSKGAVNANCSIQIDGQHYVFGSDDIWTHNGTSEQTIADQRVKDFIFGALDTTKLNRCFIAHNPLYKEIAFCFCSGDAYTGFAPDPSGTVTGCNRAAVYNYGTQTWTFDDLPYVYMGARGSVDQSLTYATVTSTYQTIGGTYQSLDGSFVRVPLFVGDTNANYSLTENLYAFDPYGPGSQSTAPVDTNATLGMTLYRDGVDLDDLDEDLQGFKRISYIVPQGRLDANALGDLMFTFGASDGFNDAPVFTTPMGYDGDVNYKIDINQAGRYLSYQATWDDYHYVTLSGFDFAYDVEGER
jgi:hypothetical protein